MALRWCLLLLLLLHTALPWVAASPLTLNAAGATLPQSILAIGLPSQPSWASSFQTLTNNLVAINYTGTGSYIGDQSIITKALDFAVADCPLSDSEIAALPFSVLQIPITLGALEFAYNIPGNANKLNLTVDVAAKIFSLQITNWNDPAILKLNPSLSYAGPITVVVRSQGSGSTFVVSQYFDVGSAHWGYGTSTIINWPAGVVRSSNVVATAQATPGAITYDHWGTAAQSGLGAAALKNIAGYWTTPTQASVNAAWQEISPSLGGLGIPGPGQSWQSFTLVNQPGATTYPLVTFSFALVYQNMSGMGAKGAAVANFVAYVNLSIATLFNFVPLPQFVIQQNQLTIQAILLGADYSLYNYYNPYVLQGGNKTAGILSFIFVLMLLFGLAGLIVKEIHYNYGQNKEKGLY